MAAGNWILTNNARLRYAKGAWNIDSATLKCALVTSSSNISASSTTWAAVTNEVASANGYTTGGVNVDLAFSGTTTITVVFTGGNPTWTASSGSIVYRWHVLYEVSGDVFAYSLGDSTPADVTVPDGYNLVVDSDGTPNPVFTLAGASS